MSSTSDYNDSKLDTPEITPRRTTRNRNRPKRHDEYLDSSPTKGTPIYVESSDEDCTKFTDSKLDTPEFTPRRTTRNRNRPKRHDEYLDSSPTKRTPIYVESSDEECTEESTPKPKALFSNDDVDGQDIFKFKSRHTKLDLQNKVKAVVGNMADSPMKTPKKNMPLLQKINDGNTQTPKHIVNIMKKKIIAEVENSDSDFSGSSSDFVPEKSDESNSSSSESNSDSNDEETQPKMSTASNSRNKNRIKPKDSEYFVTPDNYFMMNSTKKITTSDHTMARLKNMKIQENMEEEIYMSTEHQNKITDLIHTYEQYFDKWLYILSEGFNILLYGIGSKRTILQRFQERIKNTPCIVVNGFFPSLTVKSILESIVIDLLGNTHVSSNVGDVVSLIESQLGDAHLFLIVNNIDGMMLRSGKAQAVLASLAAINNVHLIASIDHINAPLLWDHSKLSKYKFTYFDVTSFLPYIHEVSDPARTHQGGGLQLAALHSVYRSLTNNAKAIFDIIVEHHLEHHKQPHYQGLPFKELYSMARERFLCSSDAALRAHLAEFIDHRLLRDSRDLLRLTTSLHVLQGFRAAKDH